MAQTFYTREEAANVLGVTPTELDKMHSSNQVPGIGKGPAIKFRADDIHALAESRSAFDTSGSYSGEFSSEFGSEANALNESQAGSLDDVSSEFSASGEFEESVETTSSSEFDLSGEVAPTQLTDPSVGSDLDIGMDSAGLGKNPSVIKMAPDEVPLSDSMDFGAPPPPSQVSKPPSSKKGSVLKLADDDALDFGSTPPAPAGGTGPVSKAGAKARPQSDVKLDMETGSFEFSLTVDSSGKLGEAAGPVSSPPSNIPRSFSGDKPPSDSALGEDSDVRLDFDAGAAPADDDDLINLGDKPDSDIRIDPVSEVRSKGGMLAGGDLMETEQIDLDAELREADQASLVKRPRSGGLPKTKATGPGGAPGGSPTMLPTTSPFELSEDDLDLGSELGASGPGTSPLGADSALGDSATGGSSAGASEFELTLAPEDESGPRTTPNKAPASPLSYGDDEDIDLGGSPSIGIGDSASHRSELSGINLQVPADSGISLEKGMSGDDSVDFELTLDEEGVSGPKTLRGKLTDSDSEFELTLDEGSSASLPKIKKSSNLGGDDQKDIFETDFDLQAAGMEGDDSQSQAMALDEQDTDLESSDFDLALEEDQGSASGEMSRDEPMELSEDGSMSIEASDIDQLSDSELVAPDEEPVEEEEPAPMTIPAAHADWGMYPLIMMVPCVLIMFLALLMSYELVHNMWGYHQTSKPSGLLVESFAKLFEEEKPAAGAPGGGAKQ